MDKKTIDFLKDTFLFSGMNDEKIAELLKNTELKINCFSKSEIIYCPTHFGKMLGFIMEGECEVRRIDGETPVPLNTLKKNTSFGALAVFSKAENYPTHVVAKKNTTVLFINKEDIDTILEKSTDAARNVISFLAKKIEFLNEKVATFSQNSVASKLAKYLLIEADAAKSHTLKLNCKKIAEKLNVGRASVYRALDTLINSGYVRSDKKMLIIVDRNGLERI